MKDIHLVMSVDVTATLSSIKPGETVFCPSSVIEQRVVRSIASRLKREKDISLTIASRKGGVAITRRTNQ